MKRIIHVALSLMAVWGLTSCTLQKSEVPPLSGPSELGLSLSLVAVPDVLTQDGFSQSLVTLETRDHNGRPLPNVPIRVEITVGGIIVDFGQLSARNVVTGDDGKALVTYTAPPPAAEPVDIFTVITLLAIPTGTDFRNATARQVDIRLVPRGVILPPNSTPMPNFTFSPSTPTAFTDVEFDASSSRDDGAIVSYAWQFGDGSTATGVRATHRFRAAGSYQVTLTVTDDRSLSASTTKTVTVGAGTPPVADFSFSPQRPAPRQEVFFNASASRAGPGRTLVSFEWDLGNGRTRSGVTVSTSYDPAGTYAVTLVVTDDAGQKGTVTKTIQVEGAPGGIIASFAVSPSDPTAGITRVFFDATSSSAPSGISSYEWDLGDGTRATGVTTDHVYRRAGNFEVRLTIRDSVGATATTSKTVTVKSGATPTADFVFSPTRPAPRQSVTFNASASTAGTGRTLVAYDWDLGNGQTRSGVTVTTSYDVQGTYTVTLTVTDDAGQKATVSKQVAVETGAPGAPVATFTFSPTDPTAGVTTVFFNASGSTAPAGIASYDWDFGDGSTATGVTASHVFAVAKTFVVRLTIRDNAGGTATTTKDVTVK